MPIPTLRDHLLLALGAVTLTSCIAEEAGRDDAEASDMRLEDARVVDQTVAPDARPQTDYALPGDCELGDFRCAPQVEGACLETPAFAGQLEAFFELTDAPVCGVDLHSGPFPPPADESEPCCYCLTVQQCGGRPFVVARAPIMARAVQRADWS